MWRFEASPRRATPKGQTFITHAAPHSEGHLPTFRTFLLCSWHTDITYLSTWQGFCYLATVIDCCTKECIGYAIADHMRAELVIDALRMAARNYRLQPEAIFHSDHGSQYLSQAFAQAAARLGVRQSMRRAGSCFDNALAESFNATLKVERVNRTAYPTRETRPQGCGPLYRVPL